jgi:hypothetical protein
MKLELVHMMWVCGEGCCSDGYYYVRVDDVQVSDIYYHERPATMYIAEHYAGVEYSTVHEDEQG